VPMAMGQWGDSQAAPDGPALEILDGSCGLVSSQILVCGTCGEAVGPRDVHAVSGTGRPTGLVRRRRTSPSSV
jgi:hypothetical protein